MSVVVGYPPEDTETEMVQQLAVDVVAGGDGLWGRTFCSI